MNHFLIDGKYKELIQQSGVDVQEVLSKAQLPADCLNQKNIQMEEADYYRLMEAWGDLMPTSMIQLATQNQIETFSPPIFASWCSKNGNVCIQRLATYKKLMGPMTYEIQEKGENLTVIMHTGNPQLSLPAFLVQSDFAFLIGILRKATQEEIVPTEITLTQSWNKEFCDFAKKEPKQKTMNSITFHKNDLEKPFISFNEAMWDYFQPEMNKRLADLEVDDSLSARVRSALSEMLPGGVFDVEEVAKKLGLSKRTLQRKLREENTTFQKQLNSVRESLAIHYVCHTDMTINDITFLLGYSEVNSLQRAFLIWTGKTISAYRQ